MALTVKHKTNKKLHPSQISEPVGFLGLFTRILVIWRQQHHQISQCGGQFSKILLLGLSAKLKQLHWQECSLQQLFAAFVPCEGTLLISYHSDSLKLVSFLSFLRLIYMDSRKKNAPMLRKQLHNIETYVGIWKLKIV